MSIFRMAFLLIVLFSPSIKSIAQAQISPQQHLSTLDSLIAVCYEKGDIRQALPYARKAMLLAAETYGKQDSIYTSFLGTYAYFLSQNGFYEEAEPLMQEELSNLADRVGHLHVDYAMSLNNLAALYIRTEQLENAEPLLLESLKIWSDLVGKQHPHYSTALNNLAALYDDLNRYTASEKLYYEVLELRRRSVGTKDPLYAAALNNLAFNYSMQDNFREAISLHKEVLDLLKAARQDKHPEYAAALLNLAHCYQKTGQNGDAEKRYQEALSLKEQVLGKAHPGYLNTLNLLADLYIHTIRVAEAEATLLEAIAINAGSPKLKSLEDPLFFESLPVFRHKSEAFVSLQKLADLLMSEYYKTGSLSKLQQQYRCSNFMMSLLNQSLREFHSEQDRLQLSAIAPKIAEKGLKALWELHEKDKSETLKQNAYEFFEQAKASAMMMVLKSKKSKYFGELPQDLTMQIEALQQKKTRLQSQILEQGGDPNHALLVQYNENAQQLKALSKKVEKDYPQYYQLQYNQKIPDLKKVQAALSPKTAIIEYFITDESAMALCISKSQVSWHRLTALRKDQLTERITQFRQSISDFDFASKHKEKAFNNFSSNAYTLYQDLIAPLLIGLPADIKQLIIIPDNRLHFIPFEVLLKKIPKAGEKYTQLPYLMLDYEISYDYSTSLWLEKSQAPLLKNGEILGMAANYEVKNDNLALRASDIRQIRSALRDLPAARAEVTAISKKFKGAFFIGENATETTFKKEISNFGIIHLALHSQMDNKYPILSGLLFSEDGDSAQNNLLQSYEISQLKTKANLVVLSACETGYGNLQHGEGVLSLGRAFMYAGVPSLIVSLWQINDESTASLMEQFYYNLSKGDNKAAALQKAKIAYLKTARGFSAHPAFWAALVHWGDIRPIPLSPIQPADLEGGNYFYFYVIILSLLTPLSMFWLLRRK